VVDDHLVLWLRALLAELHKAKSLVPRQTPIMAVLPSEWPSVAEDAVLSHVPIRAEF